MSARTYTLEEQTRGLLALVAWGGNTSAAAKSLEEQGTPIPAATLRGWMSSKREEYDRLREQYAPQMEAEMVRQLREQALYAARVQRKALELAEERLDAKRDHDPSRTAASLAKVVSSATDKVLALTGRPTQITENRTVEQITRGLVARGVIELTAGDVEEEQAA